MKRILCAIAALLAVFICAACSAALQTPDAPDQAAAPQNAAVVNGPVSVTENHADRDTVAVRPAPTAAPTEPPETPATGDVPIVPLVGALGLVLICAAGLMMLKRF